MTKPDVIIIGAGVSGLSAALALKARGLTYTILEATSDVGGRARTLRLPSGVAADLGPHWLHGEDSDLGEFVRGHKLPGREDESEAMRVYEGGQCSLLGDDFLETTIDSDKAAAIRSGKTSDIPISELGRNDEARRILRRFGQGWNGLQAPTEPSAFEFLTDGNTPGGFQLSGGIASLTSALADAIGRENIRLDRPVKSITARDNGVMIDDEFAPRVIVTASLGVWRSEIISLDVDMAEAIRTATAGLVISRMNKIILELTPGFFEDRRIPPDFSLQLLDRQPHFCHVRPAGSPLITLFTTGDQADHSETLSARQAGDYAQTVLAPVEELKGFEDHLVSEPIVTQWMANPYARGAYSALLPGFRRPAPFWQGRIGVCGDSFDDRFPASLAGAFRSGKRLVELMP
jgi:monoamine oxidase